MADPVQHARQIARAGHGPAAVALLEDAGRRGNSTAFAELAAWLLRGDIIPRDVSRARSTLRQAVEIGHVDAALLEVALTANGTGAPADWRGAFSLLAVAARNDPVAAQQLALVRAMKLDDAGYPSTAFDIEVLSAEPYIAVCRGALSAQESLHLAAIANPLLEPSVVVDPVTRRPVAHPVRSSFNATIGPAQETLPIAAFSRRLEVLTNTPLGNGEPLQILRYTVGQEYKLHSDAIPGEPNQRTVTAITYMNDGYDGGETYFPSQQIVVTPRAGDILIFHNTTADGVADPRSRHAGLPVTKGVKWIATKWLRNSRYNPWDS
ncbi:prolyl 4-hydroxylase [Sphingomonas insulae]|nr:2OG-Fe(II) oxygenase [Sphingomonas insulae]NIJ31361.1 prolyl 4-hydroxylase [Sphingomonas insulae]